MPPTSVSAPQPKGTRPEVSTESTGVLAKRVATRGKCAPGAVSVTKATFKVDADDPWFPLNPTTGKSVDDSKAAAALAEAACRGCPVKAECTELAMREELATGDVHGVRGGLSAKDRRAIYRRLRATAKDGGGPQ